MFTFYREIYHIPYTHCSSLYWILGKESSFYSWIKTGRYKEVYRKDWVWIITLPYINFSLSRYIYLSHIIIFLLVIVNIKKYTFNELQPLLIRLITNPGPGHGIITSIGDLINSIHYLILHFDHYLVALLFDYFGDQ
jgi:hypothetical protein